jgi:hypothetical protein
VRREGRGPRSALHRLPPETRADRPHEPRSATSRKSDQERGRVSDLRLQTPDMTIRAIRRRTVLASARRKGTGRSQQRQESRSGGRRLRDGSRGCQRSLDGCPARLPADRRSRPGWLHCCDLLHTAVHRLCVTLPGRCTKCAAISTPLWESGVLRRQHATDCSNAVDTALLHPCGSQRGDAARTALIGVGAATPGKPRPRRGSSRCPQFRCVHRAPVCWGCLPQCRRCLRYCLDDGS